MTDSYRIFTVTCNIRETFRITKFLISSHMITTHCVRATDVELKNDKQNIIDIFVATLKNVNHRAETL